jgi:uncharacterized protein (TIGR00369 family)
MRLVGAVVDLLGPGKALLSRERREEVLQQHGFFHGVAIAIAIAFLVDNATTIAAGTLVDRAGQGCLKAEFKVNFLAPAKGERIVSEAIVLKPHRRMTVVEARMFSDETGLQKLAARGAGDDCDH